MTGNPFREKKAFLELLRRAASGGNPPEEAGRRQKQQEMELTCEGCGGRLGFADLADHLYVCPACGHHFTVPARSRIKMVADKGSFREICGALKGGNPLAFPGYEEKLKKTRDATGLHEAVVTGTCRIGGVKAVLCVMDSRFFMGSMGTAVGEKITRSIEYATKNRLPLIIFSASGGARMQEGILSLFQMAKTSAAIAKHDEAGLLYISVLTNPTTGGVTASFASLGDVILAEPGALIGFAGPRVIEQTIRESLPDGFQRAEALRDWGFVDRVVPRQALRETLAGLMVLHQTGRKGRGTGQENAIPGSKARESGEAEAVGADRADGAAGAAGMGRAVCTGEAFISAISAADRVRLARNNRRPGAGDYIGAIFTGFLPMAGDRHCGEDETIIGGPAFFHGLPVTVIGQQKGHDLEEKSRLRFGMPDPEGYRKAARLMKQAEKFGRPVITFVDTPGAYPGKEAEERGQGEAIASCLKLMSRLKVPVLSVFIGEGGSGGALAIGVADVTIMLENSVFSILSPEGFASILWKDAGRWEEACQVMKLTASDLESLGIADVVISEAGEEEAGTGAYSYGAHQIPEVMYRRVDEVLWSSLVPLLRMKGTALAERRYQKLRAVGRQPQKTQNTQSTQKA